MTQPTRLHAFQYFMLMCFAVACILTGVCPCAAGDDLNALTFDSPAAAAERAYLGIAGETFRLGDVKADIIIVELFSLYCALCMREAPAVAELYRLAQKHVPPPHRIAFLGIGTGNSAEDVARFKKQHSVPFPLVADARASVARTAKLAITPSFIAFKKTSDGSLFTLHSRNGLLGPPQHFLDRVLQAASQQP